MCWNVFHDNRFDYRLLCVGVLLPDVVDAPFRRSLYGHSVVCVVGLLVVVMLATIGRRTLRKRLLAVVIGAFFHLVLDGAWNTSDVFWYPAVGLHPKHVSIPSLDRPLWLTIGMELVGLGLLVWFGRKFRLAEAEQRRHFLAGLPL